MPESLEDIRLKDASELTEEEQGIVKENWSQLTTEEQTAFTDFKPEEGGAEPEPFTFKSEDEFLTKVREETQKIRTEEKAEEARVKAEEEAKAKGEVLEDFVPPTYKPADWNEAAKVLYPKFRDNILKDISKMSAEQRTKLEEIDKGFDTEIAQIRVSNKDIPAKGTKEGDAFERELAEVGAKYKLTNMTDSYEIYKAVHSKKEVPVEQRNLAGKISGGGGEPAPTSGLKYNRLRRPLDDRIEEKLEGSS